MSGTIKYMHDFEEYFFHEGCHIVEVSNSPDDEALSIVRARVEPGVTTRWHFLTDTTERYVILSGQGRVEIGENEPADLGQGDVVIIPAGIRQRITNTGTGNLLFLAVCSPRFREEHYHAL